MRRTQPPTATRLYSPAPGRAALAGGAGMIAAVLFVSVFTVAGFLQPGYSATGMFVSELSLGPHGGVQVLNFVLTGLLVLVFGFGLAAHFRTVLVQSIGASLAASGLFATDPLSMTGPPTLAGIVHGILGAVVFTFAPLSCFVFYRRFRSDPAWQRLAAWTLAIGVVLALGIPLLKFSQQAASVLFEWKG